jgi:hypothetical protein
MITQERTTTGISFLQREIMRQIPLDLLVEARDQFIHGRSERSICAILGVESELFHNALRLAVYEALWERGYFSNRDD